MTPPFPMNSQPEIVLLAVTGMSPAILTETIWALAHEDEPMIPHRVRVITTAQGRDRLQRLFEPSDQLGGVTPWDALRSALEAEGMDLTGRLRFGQTGDDVRVITATHSTTGRSHELEDLRAPSDNEAAADYILEQVRGVVENPDTLLIASLAGGRKTMGALLYACITLIGRETDRLTHVLVNEPFEAQPGFWFPCQPGGPLPPSVGRGSEQQNLPRTPSEERDPQRAQVELADVPFVPLRNLFRRELGRTAGGFAALMASCGEQIRHQVGHDLRLIVRRSRPELEVNGTRIRVSPREHLLVLFLAERAKAGEVVLGAYGEAIDLMNDFRKQLRAEAPINDFSDWRHGDGLSSPFDTDGQDLRRAISSLRSKLRLAGGAGTALASCLPGKGRFSLTVPGAMIEIAP